MPILFNSKTPEYCWLSNMFPCSIKTEEGKIHWLSAEHLYVANKTEIRAEREAIRLAASPFQAKRMGREVTLREGWEEMKLNVMRGVIHAKFSQNEDLGLQLKGTYPEVLIEYAPWGDQFWGVDKNHVGNNHLGKILMEIRRLLI